jgi:hypothetical protein
VACKTPEEVKAWSQNLGHDEVLTTFYSYGAVAVDRQAEIILGLGNSEAASPKPSDTDTISEIEAMLARLKAKPKAA